MELSRSLQKKWGTHIKEGVNNFVKLLIFSVVKCHHSEINMRSSSPNRKNRNEGIQRIDVSYAEVNEHSAVQF
jgi:hypothetical protein